MKRDKIALLADTLRISPSELIDISGHDDAADIMTPSEKRLLKAYRAADPVYREIAIKLLEDNPAAVSGEKMA